MGNPSQREEEDLKNLKGASVWTMHGDQTKAGGEAVKDDYVNETCWACNLTHVDTLSGEG